MKKIRLQRIENFFFISQIKRSPDKLLLVIELYNLGR